VRQHLSDREISEVTFTVGNYMMVARVLETTGVDLDKPAGMSIVGSAKR
jgi:alkylhydroperoxidase family enzyme